MVLTGWSYRVKHNVTLTSSTTNYQVRVRLYKTVKGSAYNSNEYFVGTKCNSDYSDIRFTDSVDALLSYWIESISTTYADFWIKVSNIDTSSFIYIYYGNSSITTLLS